MNPASRPGWLGGGSASALPSALCPRQSAPVVPLLPKGIEGGAAWEGVRARREGELGAGEGENSRLLFSNSKKKI